MTWRAAGCAAALALAAGLARADEPLPPRQQALLLLRVLAYDRALRARTGADVGVAVVFDERDPGSAASAAELVRALEEAARGYVVSGLPVRVVRCPWRGPDDLASCLDDRGAAAALVAPGVREPARIARATRRAEALSATSSREGVEAGLSVGLVQRASRAALLVNLPAARQEGADLDSALLRVAETLTIGSDPTAASTPHPAPTP